MKQLLQGGVIGTLLTLSAACGQEDELSRDEKWRDDISYYRTTLESGHIDLFHTVSREQFDQELEELASQIPARNDQQIIHELMRIHRLIGDGHSIFPVMGGVHQHYPLQFRLFGDDVHVIGAPTDQTELLGARLQSIDGVPIGDILEILKPVVQPAENAYGLLDAMALHLTVDEALYGADITKQLGEATFAFELPDGTNMTAELQSVGMSDYTVSLSSPYRIADRHKDRVVEQSDELFMVSLPESNAAYIYFATYPSFIGANRFAARARRFLEKNDVENLIIDVRDNGGGDFFIGLLMASELLPVDSLDWKDGIYMMTGRHTFSAAMSNAAQFRQILNARLVGEPTGGDPNGYGETGSFRLPHSDRLVIHSKRMYRFELADTDTITPDVFVDWPAEQYFAGEDTVLNWIKDDIASRSSLNPK